MTWFVLFFLVYWTCFFAHATPLAVDASVLLHNGLEAQTLNAVFANLNASGVCDQRATACVAGSMARCIDGSWWTETCPVSNECFALPLIRRNGTFLSCTTQAIAMALINATGAQGGIAANPSCGNNSQPPYSAPAPVSSAVISVVPTSPGSVSVVTETVTKTSTIAPLTMPTLVSVLPPVTTVIETSTLNVSEVSSLLASIYVGSSWVVATNPAPLTTLSHPTIL